MNPNLTVATYNVHHRRSDAAIHQDILQLIRRGCDVIALQEMGGHAESMDNLPPEWRRHVVGGNVMQEDLAILYSVENVKLVARGHQVASKQQVVEDDAGGMTVAEKIVSWVRLRHRVSGEVVNVLNTHAVASIEHHGRPDGRHPKRLNVFGQLMNRVLRMMNARRRAGQSVILLGDLNVDYDNDRRIRDNRFPFSILTGAGMTCTYADLGLPARATQYGRYIDCCYYLGSSLEPIGHQVLVADFESDHHPYTVTFRINV